MSDSENQGMPMIYDEEWVHLDDYLTLKAQLEAAEGAIREQGKCFHCQGTGEPNCVSCHNYQGCICRPGEGRYAKSCWNCKGTGLNLWAVAALSAPQAARRGRADEDDNVDVSWLRA